MGGDQRLDPLVADELDIAARLQPSVATNTESRSAPRRIDRPVHLHLLARRGLEADDRRRSRHRLERGDKHLQHRVAAAITPLAQLTQQHARRDPVRRCRSQPSGDIALERVELGYPLRPRLVAHRLLVTKIAPHRVARNPKLAGDLAYALPMPMQNPDLQCHLCSHHPGPLSKEETLYRVGQTSIGDWVSFAPALTARRTSLKTARHRQPATAIGRGSDHKHWNALLGQYTQNLVEVRSCVIKVESPAIVLSQFDNDNVVCRARLQVEAASRFCQPTETRPAVFCVPDLDNFHLVPGSVQPSL